MNQKILTQIKFVLQSNRTSLTLIKNPEKTLMNRMDAVNVE